MPAHEPIVARGDADDVPLAQQIAHPPLLSDAALHVRRRRCRLRNDRSDLIDWCLSQALMPTIADIVAKLDAKVRRF